ncbi:isochorismatase family cysteine hydrolase [Mycolicibacterium sp. Y3]
MSVLQVDPAHTALLVVDPYNDWLALEGKLWPRISEIAQQIDLLKNLSALIGAARSVGAPVVYVPHRRWEPGDYEDWVYPNPTQNLMRAVQAFTRGSWGGQWHPDLAPCDGEVVAKEHWAQNGFANTDLDFQLRQRSIGRVLVTGLLANTCVEATARAAMELGYHVTLITDATATFAVEMMDAAHALNGPTYAHQITTTADALAGAAAPVQAR